MRRRRLFRSAVPDLRRRLWRRAIQRSARRLQLLRAGNSGDSWSGRPLRLEGPGALAAAPPDEVRRWFPGQHALIIVVMLQLFFLYIKIFQYVRHHVLYVYSSTMYFPNTFVCSFAV